MDRIAFKSMAFVFKIRDIFLPPRNTLIEAEIKPGFCILDYGCGPGAYSIAAAEIVGDSGKVYALDIHPLAIEQVQNSASKKGLKNIETICSDCETKLPDNSVDAVLLYDTFHDLSDSNKILKELHRVLKPDGIMSFSDHHMKESDILSKVTDSGFFRLSDKGKWTYSFLRS